MQAGLEAKSVKKDEKLKRPSSAYFLFSNDKRDEVQELLGTKQLPVVARKCTEMWKAMTEVEKKPWTDTAQQREDAYGAYVKTPEGAAALKAYKEEVQEAKAGVTGRHRADAESLDENPAKKAKAGA